MRIRLDPSDEYMHPGPEPTFNESMYFNVYDASARVGGFVRVGNRPNEGHAEMTVCLYLPDGRVAFMFQRADIDGNERFDAGGATIEVVEPFLLKSGFIIRTSQGRKASEKAFHHLDLPTKPGTKMDSLFDGKNRKA